MANKKNINNTRSGVPPAKTAQSQSRPQIASLNNDNAAAHNSLINRFANWFIVGGISLLTFLFFRSCLDNQFTNWDDLGYITMNSLIKDQSAAWLSNIFSVAHPVMGNYHPLTILLYAIEYRNFGLQPWFYHLDSLLLHIVVTIAVYLFIKVLTGRNIAAAITALLFGLHPMHVESVAWAAGRKDLLYGLFFVLASTAYLFYIRNKGTKKTIWYVCVLLLFACSLLAKSVAVSLPVTLLAIDYLEKRKWNWALLIEKLPHFGLALLFGILSVSAQKATGAMDALDVTYKPLERLDLGCYALCTYLWKAVIPEGLSNYYPYPAKVGDVLPVYYNLFIAIVLGLSFIVWRYGRKNRALVFGIGFFAINIFLLLQFIPVGNAIVSDRYGYIPYLGLFFIAGWFVSELFQQKVTVQKGKIALAVVVAFSLAMGYLTSERCQDWYSSITIWKDDVAKHPESPLGYSYLGQEYLALYEKATNASDRRRLGDSSMYCFHMSLLKKPDFITPLISIANMQRINGQTDSARKNYLQAMALNSKNDQVYEGLGIIYSMNQQYDSAGYCFRKAIEIRPLMAEGYCNFANLLDITGKTDSSLAIYAKAISLDPDAYMPYLNMGRLFFKQKKYDDAIKNLDKSIERNAEYGETYYLRAVCHAANGNKALALQDVDKAKALGYGQINPNFYEQLKLKE
jgi:tetratricopeptide (TPR) repeat protein